MSGQPPASAGDAKTSPLQDKKVQLGIGAGVLVLVIIGVAVGVMMNNKPAETVSPNAATPPAATGTATNPAGGTGMNAMGAGGTTTAPPMGAAPAGGVGPPGGSMTMPGAASNAPGGERARPRGPGVPSRGNPFAPNNEIKAVIVSIPSPPNAPTQYASSHDLYTELNPPEPDVQVVDDGADQGPPIPPMRVTGIVQGTVVSAIIQMGDGNAARFINVVPGKMIPDDSPVYRVASIDSETVVLVRRWEQGNRKGVQRIEVNLSGSALRGGGGGGGNAGPLGGILN